MLAPILLFVTEAFSSCFLPNGTDRNSIYNSTDNSTAYLPCHTVPDGEASMCCRLGDADPDTCRHDGLCQGDAGWYWRESCTDNTWQAKGCVKLCIDGAMGNDDVRLKQCDDGSWCCDQHGDGFGDECCSRNQGKWVNEDGEVVNTKPASSTVVAKTTSVSSSDLGMPIRSVIRHC
ncbi:hypothetical protein GTA08_BOTSDO13683 [Neofusicoccum parvum]|nr:hypothetical protein GTA08_BOTSDO13683 [Neofusicoccum parvum]